MSCGNSSTINETFILEATNTGDSITISACTAIYTNHLISCSGNSEVFLTSGATIFNTDLLPLSSDTIDIGTPSRRFRDINTVSGTTTIWVATTRVETPMVDLGLDLSGNSRVITADSSILEGDIIFGGSY